MISDYCTEYHISYVLNVLPLNLIYCYSPRHELYVCI